MTTSIAAPAPRERPILFSAPMIRAILDGRKTQTRRTVKMPDDAGDVLIDPGGTVFGPGPYLKVYKRNPGCDAPMYPRNHCPYGYPDDRLWVRETHALVGWDGFTHVVTKNGDRVMFRADGAELPDPYESGPKWRPSIFMPRWASRITLEITEVRVQRLQEITEDDARAEGCRGVRGAVGQMIPGPPLTAREDFERLWDSINGKPRPMLDDEGEPVLDDDERPRMVASRSWSSNPWIWAVSFRRIP